MPVIVMEDFVVDLPKIELHAHLNGSVSAATLEKLAELKQHTAKVKVQLEKQEVLRCESQEEQLKMCFGRFKRIHQLSDSEEAVKMVTEDVIREFAEDNVKYLELRTTPRDEPTTRMTRQSSIATVVSTMKQANHDRQDIITRLMLSINRATCSQADAMETVKMAGQLFQETDGMVLGVDIGGNPGVGDARDFIHVFQYAKSQGLKLSLHLAEIPGYNTEIAAILELPPDRIGHGTCLQPEKGGTQQLVDTVKKLQIPIEACMTSNVILHTVNTYSEHHFKYWYDSGHPVSLGTDDKGVFQVNLSHEYSKAASTFDLTHKDLFHISQNAIDQAFCDNDVKEQLRAAWKDWERQNKDRF